MNMTVVFFFFYDTLDRYLRHLLRERIYSNSEQLILLSSILYIANNNK